MKKLLLYTLSAVVLLTTGCARMGELTDSSFKLVEDLPFIYRPEIQQGNVVTQEMVDKLEPGMTKSQVHFVMGSPMLVDLFHQDRWDYIYTMKEGNNPRVRQQLHLLFEDDRLTTIAGDLRPMTSIEAPAPEDGLVVDVPDYVPNDGIFSSALSTVGLGQDDD
ncbi:MAG: outer membrane protein assembly factor BamE [Gammaproteobacteria bacterium]|nr:outer membrane protein assembly factor BamE [Gammaproteobacteria bacterium]